MGASWSVDAQFSTNPDVAEQQMNAIIFYLTAFGYIDGEFDFTEKTFVRIYIRQLVTARAKTAMPDADAKTRDEIVNKFVGHFHEVFEQIDRSVSELFTEAVADGEDVEKFVYSKLKLRSYEIFQTFERDNQHELLVDDRRADLRRRQRPSGGGEVPRGARGAARLDLDPARPSDIEILRDQSHVAIESATDQARRATRTTRSSRRSSSTTPRIPSGSASRSMADLDLMNRFVDEAQRAAARRARTS